MRGKKNEGQNSNYAAKFKTRDKIRIGLAHQINEIARKISQKSIHDYIFRYYGSKAEITMTQCATKSVAVENYAN